MGFKLEQSYIPLLEASHETFNHFPTVRTIAAAERKPPNNQTNAHRLLDMVDAMRNKMQIRLADSASHIMCMCAARDEQGRLCRTQ